jgi:hypothetical protein
VKQLGFDPAKTYLVIAPVGNQGGRSVIAGKVTGVGILLGIFWLNWAEPAIAPAITSRAIAHIL